MVRSLEAGLEGVRPEKEAEDMTLGNMFKASVCADTEHVVPISQMRKLRPQRLVTAGDREPSTLALESALHLRLHAQQVMPAGPGLAASISRGM